MSRTIRNTAEIVTTTLLLLCAGVPVAFAGPQPIDPNFPPPPATPAAPDVSLWTEVRWMLNGAGVLLALAAVALVAVLWHRSHAATHRLVTQ